MTHLLKTTSCHHEALLTVGVHLVDHVLQLGLCGVLTQRAHDGAQLFGGDGSIAVLVKERERLFELCREGAGESTYSREV